MKRYSVLTLMCIITFFSVFAADEGSPLRGFILNSTGSGFSVYRQGVFQSHGTGSGEVTGFPLYAGDMVYTNADSTLVVQLLPGTGVLQAGENTSFQLSLPGQPDEVKLQYGRIKVVSDGSSALTRNIRSSIFALSDAPVVLCLDQFIDSRGLRRNSMYVVDGKVTLVHPSDMGAYTALVRDGVKANNGGTTVIPTYLLQSGMGISVPVAESMSDEKKAAAYNLEGVLLEPYTGEQPELNAYWNERSSDDRRLQKEFQEEVFLESPSWPKDDSDVFRITRLIRALVAGEQSVVVHTNKAVTESGGIQNAQEPAGKSKETATAEVSDTPATRPAVNEKKEVIAPRLADSIAPIDILDPAAAIQNSVTVFRQDQEKIAGIWMGFSGILLDLLAVSMQLYGNTIFGFQQADCDTTAIILGSAGSGILIGGIVIYLDGLFN